jgi:hypothetical protein
MVGLALVIALLSLAQVARAETLRPVAVRRISRDGTARNGEGWVSNGAHHVTVMQWAPIEGWGDCALCVRVTGPADRLPLMVQVRALTMCWGHITTWADLTGAGPWYADWTDGYDLLLTGPGWYCTRVTAETDYWRQQRNCGIVLVSLYDPHASAGRTYRLSVSDTVVYMGASR